MISLVSLLISFQSSTLVIDPSAKVCVWEGWGTSLCWMGNSFGERKDLADFLFTTKMVRVGSQILPGLGLNIVRYNAGACGPGEVEGKSMVLSKDVLAFRQMEGFWIDPTKGEQGWDWSRDKGQRAMMLNAKARGANRFELFSNSPMWWMCANNNPSGAAQSTDDNLRVDQQGAFAHYLATIAAQSDKRWGVRFTSIEPFNEPASDYWGADGRQEGCHFSAATQAAFLPVLRAELDRQGLQTLPIVSSDETSFDQALSTWNAFDSNVRSIISRENVHGYRHTEGSRLAFATALETKPRWNSEHGDGDATGLTTARELSLDLNQLRPSAWCYWQPLDGGGWGLLNCDMVAAKVKEPNPKLYVLAQYMRHIRPGMTILASVDPKFVSAYDPRKRKLVVVAQGGETPSNRTLDLSAFRISRHTVKRWITVPKGQERYVQEPNLAYTGSSVTVNLPAESIQTFEIEDVTPQR
jgi:galactan endo-1,6-beta-galactosidase